MSARPRRGPSSAANRMANAKDEKVSPARPPDPASTRSRSARPASRSPRAVAEEIKAKLQSLRLTPADATKVVREVARRFRRPRSTPTSRWGSSPAQSIGEPGTQMTLADVPLRGRRRDERHARPPAPDRARGRAPRSVDPDDDRPRGEEAQERPRRGPEDRAPDRGDDGPRRRVHRHGHRGPQGRRLPPGRAARGARREARRARGVARARASTRGSSRCKSGSGSGETRSFEILLKESAAGATKSRKEE